MREKFKKMKNNLKIRLIVSNLVIAVVLVFSLYFISNYFFQKQFQSYIISQQEVKNKEIVQVISNAYNPDGSPPELSFFEKLGTDLLEQHLILTVYNEKQEQIFCMACLQRESCRHSMNSMKDMMTSLYPNLKGKYVETNYSIEKNEAQVGSITLGYFGPFFYNERDFQFVQTFNDSFALITIFALFGSVALGIFSAAKISKPIMRIHEKTKQISEGNYSGTVYVGKHDTVEIKELAQSVNSLAHNLENQLFLKQRMAGDFTHEFLTPLTVLQGTIEAMLDGVFEVNQERLQQLRNEVERLSRMVYEIELVVTSSPSLEYEKEMIDFGILISEVIQTFETELYKKNQTIHFQEQTMFLNASKDKMKQVVFNLLSNAIKYTNDNGKITISLNQTDEFTVFQIEDTGIGIEEENIPYLFEYLYKVDPSRTRSVGGSGIGLYVVKTIVDAHKGNIEVKSVYGKGTTFIVKLPNK